ncbi:MAG: CaiB/BaiF CoA transferase family protein [Gammaproteobacteria bacterium]|uniref:CaiB/BaiF CoA transferase family protein n=1 Tax=Bradyrhizobium sp. TaxID=376 RepID=UPI003D0B0D3F
MPMPLDGILVLELNRVAPGSLCTMMLGDMGADVIRLETPAAAGAAKSFTARDDEPWTLSEFANRNKRSLALNLKDPRGRQVLHALAARADVVVEGFRPNVTVRLGADYATLSGINPRLVYCSLSGFGPDGPYRDRAGHDLNYLALAGVLGQLGAAGVAPPIPLNLIADYAGASLHGVIGILLALLARAQTGRGQHVDVSYLDTAFALLMAVPGVREALIGGAPVRRGENVFAGQHPYYAVYPTLDGRWLSVGCMEPWLWDNFCDAVGRPDLKPARMRREDFSSPPSAQQCAAKRELEALMRTRTLEDWLARLAAADVCIGEVNDLAGAFADPQLRHRGMLVPRDDDRVPGAMQPGIAIKLSETPGRIRSAPPRTGADTHAVLRDLGYGDADIAALRADGVV